MNTPTKREQPQTGWVVPPQPIRGLDHLGVQAPCIALYGQLLPGITNVTDRARYYSFYPWLCWAIDQRYADRTRDGFARILRRAECLLALVAAHHEAVLGEDERDHGVATVGRDKLRPQAVELIDGGSIDLEDYAAFECEDRYFKNRLGGLGQYYFGPLRDLKLLDYVDGNSKNAPGYDRERGAHIAGLFESVVDSRRFFKVLDGGTLSHKDLEKLHGFCPCALHQNDAERAALLDLFLARTEGWADEAGKQRRASLALVMDLVRLTPEPPEVLVEGLLRATAYSGMLAVGKAWSVPEAWHRARAGWGAYSRNEMLSVAMQGLFWAQLGEIAIAGGAIASTRDAANMLSELLLSSVDKSWRGLTVAQATERLQARLPPRTNWWEENHEIDRAWRVASLARGEPDEDAIRAVAAEAILLLLTLLARGLRENPYAEFDLDPSYFSPQEIHLLTLRRWSLEWAEWPLSDWFAWLGSRWTIERHLHVALRKLRADNRDTFRIRPLDSELTLVEIPPVVFTSPRVTRAQQILRDLGLVVPNDDGDWYRLTDSGQAELEACRG
ncbi:MAG: hypothetical protein R3B13_38070 [Polyangiaceae bacterium]